ncbi:MAG: hypothetical protein EZS28_004612 [Streblomastix strix]|uniref:Uncharacterized protein n=1 Tax=Streblomastix strix TaxID=222440 RepID=A0A5J4WXP4_9EUKA|nr:MAG: hypothetical protein EZS28_004612 [Streblomastix strix]
MHYLCDAIIRFTFDDAPDPLILNFEIIGEVGGTMIRNVDGKMAQSQKVSQLSSDEFEIKSQITEYSPQERDQITILYSKTADRLHLDYNRMLQEAESHRNDSLEEFDLFVINSPRISEKLIQLYDFMKFNDEITPLDDDEQVKPVKTRRTTGKAINIADCPYLAIVDMEIDKKLSQEERNLIRNELLEKIYQSELNVALVKTGHGGLHIYCNMDPPILFAGNSIVKKITTEQYDINIFACVDYNECKRCIVLPDSRIKDFEYDTVNKRQQPKKPNQVFRYEKLGKTKIKFDKKKDQDLISEKETTLFKLFSSVNGMKAIADVDLQSINEAYNKISQIQGLTIKARSNFDRTRIKLAERSFTPHYIEKLVKLTNEEYCNSEYLSIKVKSEDTKSQSSSKSLNDDESSTSLNEGGAGSTVIKTITSKI